MAAHVYHWKHGWIPLDHTAALAKAKGNHKKAAEMLSASTSHDAGIKTKRDVAKAALGLSSIPDAGDRHNALRNVQDAATQLDAHDTLGSSLFPAKGTDQYGHPTSYLGHSVASSRATQGGASGVVHSMHNGTDRSGLDATSRATVFVPDVNQQAGKAQAKSMTPAELRAQNQGDYRTGEEVAIKVAGGTRIATIREVAPDGRLVLHIPGHGGVTRSAEDLSRQISTATRAAEDRRINGDWRKTPTSRLRMALHSSMFSAGQKAAMQAELTRRGD